MMSSEKTMKSAMASPRKAVSSRRGSRETPSGRPKKSPDFYSELKQELNLKLIINENGKRKVITKSRALKRQIVNKGLSGSVQAASVVFDLDRQGEEKTAEQQQNSPNKRDLPTLRAEDLSDDELAWIVRQETLKHLRESTQTAEDPMTREFARKLNDLLDSDALGAVP
jgi:hypothetical protein